MCVCVCVCVWFFGKTGVNEPNSLLTFCICNDWFWKKKVIVTLQTWIYSSFVHNPFFFVCGEFDALTDICLAMQIVVIYCDSHSGTSTVYTN